MSDVEIKSVAYLRELSRSHDEWENDPACLAAEWAADEIDSLNSVVAKLTKDCNGLEQDLDFSAAIIDRLRTFARIYAICPCCEQDRECKSGCTFATDAPADYEEMQAARVAIWGQ